MKFRSLGIAGLSIIVSFAAVAAGSESDTEKGKKLFEKYGCTNCHGQDGIHPNSKYVPVLKGKSTAYIFENASAIFDGERSNRKLNAMHDQFCIGEKPEEGCYPAPSVQELKTIAAWLGSSSIPEKKRTPQGLYVTSLEANQKLKELKDKALFIDIRTRSEVAFLGMPKGIHANIPYMTVGVFDEWDEKKQTFKLQPNSEFVLKMEELVKQRGLGKDSPIFLICRSGNRSAKASKLLNLTGYINVYTVTDGFEGDKAKHGPRKGERVVNGWKNNGLPWSYKLPKYAMYWEM